MSRRRLTADQKAERLARRIVERAEAAQKAEDQRSWLQSRVDAAQKRLTERRKAKRPARGVDRVPDHLLDLYVTVEAHEVSKHGTPIDSTPGTYGKVTASYATRRAMGQRGHRRKPRLRELPGAQARRRELRRQEWLA